ncbi:hypothetical protein [Vibrio campbellii]|uniref:hypothetical protein n=1 Tax=Vibrio campbellii TaxID=680 RepID=UPI000693814B|nr:hypothetical protein [Vibrio phage HY01]
MSNSKIKVTINNPPAVSLITESDSKETLISVRMLKRNPIVDLSLAEMERMPYSSIRDQLIQAFLNALALPHYRNLNCKFISHEEHRVRVHIHLPDDSLYERSFTTSKGRDKAMRKALKERDNIGKKAWGKFWDRVLSEPGFFERMPHSLEPKQINKVKVNKNGSKVVFPYYAAIWADHSGKGCGKKTKLFSIKKMGALGAYNAAKRHLQEVHADYIPVIKHMERFNVNELL